MTKYNPCHGSNTLPKLIHGLAFFGYCCLSLAETTITNSIQNIRQARCLNRIRIKSPSSAESLFVELIPTQSSPALAVPDVPALRLSCRKVKFELLTIFSPDALRQVKNITGLEQEIIFCFRSPYPRCKHARYYGRTYTPAAAAKITLSRCAASGGELMIQENREDVKVIFRRLLTAEGL